MSPASATRLRAVSAWERLMVTPTTRAPCTVAACSAIDPQPQPTSSSRAPGFSARPSLRQISSCLARWAAARLVASLLNRAQEYVMLRPSTSR